MPKGPGTYGSKVGRPPRKPKPSRIRKPRPRINNSARSTSRRNPMKY